MEYELWENETGRSPVGDFIKSLNLKTRAKMVKRLDKIAEGNLTQLIASKTLKPMRGAARGLLQMTVSLPGNSYRTLCRAKNGILWLLHIFPKRSNRTPPRAISTAVSRMEQMDD